MTNVQWYVQSYHRSYTRAANFVLFTAFFAGIILNLRSWEQLEGRRMDGVDGNCTLDSGLGYKAKSPNRIHASRPARQRVIILCNFFF